MQSISPQENRVLATMPSWGIRKEDWQKNCNFALLFESFYNDHFVGRTLLVRFKNGLYRHALHSSANQLCALGQRKCIFYADNKLPIAQQNQCPFGPDELRAWTKMFVARRNMAARQNINYIVMIAPEKGTVYPELMPAGWARLNQASRLDQLQSELRLKNVQFVNAEQILLRAKPFGQTLYFFEDSHWNYYGAFLVAQGLFRSLNSRFPAIVPFDESQFGFIESKHTGDLGQILQSGNKAPQEVAPLVYLRSPSATKGMLNLSRFDGGISEQPPTSFQVCNSTLPRAFILHDSFMEFLQPFIAEKFRFSEYHLARFYLPDIVFAASPDVVIDELAERHLYDRNAENYPDFNKNIQTQKSVESADFGKLFQLRRIDTRKNADHLVIDLHWTSLSNCILNQSIIIDLLNSKDGTVLSTIEYEQDGFKRNVDANVQWTDQVVIKVPRGSFCDQLGVTVRQDQTSAMSCASSSSDFHVRAKFHLSNHADASKGSILPIHHSPTML